MREPSVPVVATACPSRDPCYARNDWQQSSFLKPLLSSQTGEENERSEERTAHGLFTSRRSFDLVAHRVGTRGEEMAEQETILEAQGLTKEFKGFVAVKNVNLRVRRHTIHALIGPNGAGKTTCFNLLTHFLHAHGGRIEFNGRDITGSSPAAIARMGLARSFQISAVFPASLGARKRPRRAAAQARAFPSISGARNACSTR